MKAFIVLGAAVITALGVMAWIVAQTDWSTKNYAADPGTSLIVDNQLLPCDVLMAQSCDRNHQHTIEQAARGLESFLSTPNLVTLVATGALTNVDAVSSGLQICSNRSWSGSPSRFADKHPNIPSMVTFVVWSAATQTLCPTMLS